MPRDADGQLSDAFWESLFELDSGVGQRADGSANTYDTHTNKTANMDLPPEMSQAQKEAYLVATENEPKITNDLLRIMHDVSGKLAGLDFRLKTPESYMRKISTDMAKDALEENAAINGVCDTIRYTNVSTPETLVDVFLVTVEKLEAQGYTLSRVKNTWNDPNNPYKGINTIFRSPTGQTFELQFHTQESFDLKQEQLHTLYEEARLTFTSGGRMEELTKLMQELSSGLQVPNKIEKIK